MLRTCDLHVRDPFILTGHAEQLYYLYGTNHINGTPPGPGFDVYTSRDLECWEGPFPVFRPFAAFWADRNYWAPEVYFYKGQVVMFASFKAPGVCRGTQSLAAPSPLGPFRPLSPAPLTPAAWEALDGTLFVDGDGTPWMVFCHEWVQVEDGEICAVRLSEDLTRAEGDPVLLFRASEAPWISRYHGKYEGQPREGYVTDGPFLFHGQDGSLRMLWSSYDRRGYVQAAACSQSGRVEGPWKQQERLYFAQDGGHGMIFETLAGKRMLSLHTPNCWPGERPLFLPFEE